MRGEERAERCLASTFLIFDTLLVNESGFVLFILAGYAEEFSFCRFPPILPSKPTPLLLHGTVDFCLATIMEIWLHFSS